MKEEANDIAIDFQKMYRLEKKKAREKRRTFQKVVPKEETEKRSHTEKNDWTDGIVTDEKCTSKNPSQESMRHWDVHPKCVTPKFKLSETHCISSSPKMKHVYYVPEFIHESYCQYLLKWLQTVPRQNHDKTSKKEHCSYDKMTSLDREKWHDQHVEKWTKLVHANRNVAIFSSIGGRKVPSCLQTLIDALVDTEVFPESHTPNHILINEYQPDGGIIPHTDGPSYFNRTATISIGGDILFKFKRKKTPCDNVDPPCSLELMLSGKGSLVVFSDGAYSDHLHYIEEGLMNERSSDLCTNVSRGTNIERGYRISMTFRHKYIR